MTKVFLAPSAHPDRYGASSYTASRSVYHTDAGCPALHNSPHYSGPRHEEGAVPVGVWDPDDLPLGYRQCQRCRH